MYLIIDNNNFGFSLKQDENLKSVEITDEDYNTFFKNQSEGKQYKLKDELPEENGGLFDYLEEYVQEQHKDENIEPTQEERLKSLEAIINDFILDEEGGDING